MEHIIDLDSDIVFLTETWLESDNNSVTAEVKSYGYRLLHDRRKDRDKETGGGVGILIKSKIDAKQLKVKHYTSFEHTIVKLPMKRKNQFMFLISIYRLQLISTVTFFEEFANFLDLYTISNENFIIAGDVNIHTETKLGYSKRFKELIDIYNLKQHIPVPTHEKGHTLDVVITPNIEFYLGNINISKLDLSDHFLVDFNIICEPAERLSKTITYRSIKNADMEKFRREVKERLDVLPQTNNMLDRVHDYNTTLANLVEEHAPRKTKEIKVVPEAPWFNAEYAEQRKLRRNAEKKYRKSGLESDKKVYVNLRKETINSAFQRKKLFITKKYKKVPPKRCTL